MKRKYLSNLRRDRKITQQSMAAKLGMTSSQYECLERGEGRRRVDAELADKIAKILNVNVDYLLDCECEIPVKAPRSQVPSAKLNPNPPTQLTRKIICWYVEDGDSVEEIGKLLGRSIETITEILERCIRNGEYKRYNALRKRRIKGLLL